MRLGGAAARAIAALGVTLAPENRLALSLRVVEEASRSPAHTLAKQLDAQQSIIEAFLVSYVARRTRKLELAGKLRALLHGTLELSRDLDSRARDEQFEVFVWALLELAGLGLVTAEEPDFVVSSRRSRIGVAVKRLSSSTSLSRHVKKAAKQMSRHGVDVGILAINVDVPLRRHDGDRDKYISSIPEQVELLLSKITRDHRIEAVVVVGAIPRVAQNGLPSLNYVLSTRLLQVPEEDQSRTTASFNALGSRIRERVERAVAEGIANG